MKKQAGFILLMTTLILWVCATLTISEFETFIISKKINIEYARKNEAFYRSEAEIVHIRNLIAAGENNQSAKLIKIDNCKNQYIQINSPGKNTIRTEYLFFNQTPPSGCRKPSQIYQKLWWRVIIKP